MLETEFARGKDRTFFLAKVSFWCIIIMQHNESEIVAKKRLALILSVFIIMQHNESEIVAKKRLALILSVFFLAQSAAFSQDFLPRTTPVNPTAKVSLNKPEISFLKKYDFYILCTALLVYKLDVIERRSKGSIVEEVDGQYDGTFFRLSDIDFDLANIDYFRNKGYTRYYPFRVNNVPYIIRIFRTDEKVFQPDVEVIYEGNVKNPAVTFQILKGVNAILEQCRLKPHEMPSYNQADSCP